MMTVTTHPQFLELVPGRLYAFGGNVPLDDPPSWAPSSATGYQPSNSFLLRRDVDILIDTGVSYVREQMIAGLERVLPPGAPISVFLTRALLDCVGGLASVVDIYTVQEIFTGGAPNPFDQFDATPAAAMGVHRSPDDPPLEIFAPALRILPSYWGYDPETRTTFTSDSFTHATLDDPSELPVIADGGVDTVTETAVREHLEAAFWWLPLAEGKALIADQIREFFVTHPTRIIAPSRGCVLMGDETVRRHVAMLVDAIASFSETRASRDAA
jgi:hypothetical protein